MRKIKVLRIIARLNIGGPAIHTVLLTEGLDKSRFESWLVCGAVSPGEGDMAYYAEERGVKPIYIPELRRELNPFNDLVALAKIFRIIKKEKPDIIHTHTAKAGTLGRLAGICYNCLQGLLRPFGARNDDRGGICVDAIRLIHTFHGHVFDGYFNCFLSKIFIIIEKALAHFTDKIITVSEEVKQELIALGIAKAGKITIIPLGFELEKFLNANGREYKKENANGREFRIGIVGRLVPIKNHRLFLEAANRLRRSLVNEDAPSKVKFIIIGDGELREDLVEYSRKLNLSECVEFSGWQKDLAKVYANLDIVCLTSINEGTPVSLIEAMASARAIVATEVGGVMDLLGEEIEPQGRQGRNFIKRQRGITVKSQDVNGLAQALRFISEDKALRKNLSQAGREYVKDKFAKGRLIKDIEELYLKTLKIC